MKNPLFDFIAEFVIRLFSAKPQFFVVIQWISIVVGGISAGLSYWQSLGKVLPEWVISVSNANVMVGAIVALIMAQLPLKDPQPQVEEPKN